MKRNGIQFSKRLYPNQKDGHEVRSKMSANGWAQALKLNLAGPPFCAIGKSLQVLSSMCATRDPSQPETRSHKSAPQKRTHRSMHTTEPADAAFAAVAATGSISDGTIISMRTTSMLAHAALDALDVADKYRQPLSAWRTAHEKWCAAFPPASLNNLV